MPNKTIEELAEKFNPGSDSALEKGCSCPVIDNHFGKGRPNGDFIYSMDCKYHYPTNKQN